MPHDLSMQKPVMPLSAILRIIALSSVHVSTTPLLRDHAQAASSGAWAADFLGNARIRILAVAPNTHYGLGCRSDAGVRTFGLISSLSCYFPASTTNFFIESPYRKIKGGRVIDYVTIVNVGTANHKVAITWRALRSEITAS